MRVPNVSESGRPIGTPYQVAMLDGETAVFTDVKTHTVRYLHNSTSMLLAGDAREDSYDGGGFRDGPSGASLFDDPLGILAAPDGSLLVADGGNRRIRRIAGFDRRQVVDRWVEAQPVAAAPPAVPPTFAATSAPTPSLPTQPTSTPSTPAQAAQPPNNASTVPLPPARDGSRDFRILYLGNSIIWWDTDWSHSIAGVAERAVNHALPARGPRVRFVPVRLQGASVGAFGSYLEEIANTGLVDAVILHLNDGTVVEGPPQRWTPPAVAALRRAHQALQSSHVPLLIVANPIPLELGPESDTWTKLLDDALTPQYIEREDAWRTVLATSGAPAVDLWPAFFDDIRSPDHRPIFSTDDAHLSRRGRELVGDAIAAELLRLRPWTAGAGR